MNQKVQTISNKNLIALLELLHNFEKIKSTVSIVILYNLNKNKQTVKQLLVSFDESINLLLNQYCLKDESGRFLTDFDESLNDYVYKFKNTETRLEFLKHRDTLLDITQDVNLSVFELDEFKDISLVPSELTNIELLFEYLVIN
jgi:hypothetical protein